MKDLVKVIGINSHIILSSIDFSYFPTLRAYGLEYPIDVNLDNIYFDVIEQIESDNDVVHDD